MRLNHYWGTPGLPKWITALLLNRKDKQHPEGFFFSQPGNPKDNEPPCSSFRPTVTYEGCVVWKKP